MVATIGPVAGVAVHVELGYYPEGSSLISRWGSAKWNTTGAWESGTPPRDDISCDVESVSINTGRDQPLDRFRSSTCQVTLNDPAGKYSPWATASNTPSYTVIRPGIDLFVWVETDTDTYYRFAGRVDSITDLWPDPSPDLDARHQVVFQAHDMVGELAAFDGVELPPVGAGELTGDRVERILTNAGYIGPRTLDVGTVTVQATTLAKNAVDEIGITTDTEQGAFFADGTGDLRFLDRNGLHTDTRYTTVQAVFGEVDPELCYTDIQLASDSAKVRNLVSIGRVNGAMADRADLDSQAMFGVRTYRRTDLMHETDALSPGIADAYLATFAYAANRVERLTVTPTVHPEQLDACLALGPLQLIEVRRRTRGFQTVATLQIEAVTESIAPHDWTIEYTTFPATGVFDVGRWDRDTWGHGEWGY